MLRATPQPTLQRCATILSALLLAAAAFAAPQDEAPADAARDVIVRRGDLPPITGTITRIDDAGVLIRTTTGAASTAMQLAVPWHVVRDIDSERFDDDWKRYAPNAEQLWRAVIRLQRHDPALAEALLERLFETYRGQTHETALVVAEGLLRARLARAANELAIAPWLEAARNIEAGVTTEAYADLAPVIDSATLLCPQLPPAWPHGNFSTLRAFHS